MGKGSTIRVHIVCHLRRQAHLHQTPVISRLGTNRSLYPRILNLQSVPPTSTVGIPNCATYQTDLNHPRHSKFALLRLTLRMLWFLRAPLMVRTAFIAFLLTAFVATSAVAARIDALRTPAHASISKSTVHRAHPRPTSHSLTAKHAARGATPVRGSRITPRRDPRYGYSSGHRATSSTSHSATLRRTRYNRYHSKGHFVPLATVPVSASRPESGEMNIASRSGVDSAPSTARPLPADDLTSESHPAESSAADSDVPSETDILPATGTDRAAMVASGNPLAAPREGSQPVAPSSGQIAELYRPPIITGRVSSYTLRGTHDSLVRQNARSEDEALERIEDDADLQDRIARGLLVRVPESSALTVNSALPEDRRYCRPWTAEFLANLAHAHQAQFHTPIVVSSAVRTVEYQKQLMRTNHNAADAEGDIVSPHLTGATIDIAKAGLSRREMEWMRNQLLGYQNAGVIDVEEEFHQRCFHITVYKNYGSSSQLHKSPRVAPAPAAPQSDSLGVTAASDVIPNE